MDESHASSKALERRIRQHVIAAEHDFFAVVQPGFEKTACGELSGMGIHPSGMLEGGLEFSGRLETCYRVNIASRTVTRVLMRLADFHAENERVLSRRISSIPWELYLPAQGTIGINASSSSSRLYHTGLIAEAVEKGIRTRCTEYGIDPSYDSEFTQRIYVRIHDNRCTVSLDTTGEPLYRRGRKRYVSTAPLRETLASLILAEASFTEYPVLFDPMCGSGTFSLEAGEFMAGILPGMGRDFPFIRWPAFRPAAFNHMVKKLVEEHLPAPCPERIIAWDHDENAANIALRNIREAGLWGRVTVEKKDFLIDVPEIPSDKPLLIIMNPPYGRRLDDGKIKSLYGKIGEVIRQRYPEAGFAILVPGEEYESILGLTWDRKILFFNGGIPVGLILRNAPLHR